MKVVEVLGSPHGINGNTGVVSNQVLLAVERAVAGRQTESAGGMQWARLTACARSAKQTEAIVLAAGFG